MTVIPKNRDFHFKDDEPMGLVIGEHQERKKLLAAERKADYNKFISEKQNTLHKKGYSPRSGGNSSGSSLHYEQIVQRRREEEEQYRNSHYDESDINAQLLKTYMERNKNLIKELEYYMAENNHYQELLLARSSNSHSSANASTEAKVLNSPHESSYSLPMTSQNMQQSRVRGHPSDSTIGQSIFGIMPFENLSKVRKEQYAKELEKQVYENQIRKAHQTDEIQRNPLPPRHEVSPFSGGCRRATVKDSAKNIINADKVPLGLYGTHYYSFEKLQQENEWIKKKNYEAELKLQIVEKNRLDAEQKRKQKLEEEREAERFHQERLKMQKEYEEEQAKRRHKEEQERLRRERIAELQASRAKEEEERRRREESERKEREKQKYITMESQITDHPPKPTSPPIPSIRTKASNLPEEPPKPITVPILNDVAEMRQSISKQRKEYDSKMKREKETYKVMDRRTLHDDSDDDDNELQNIEYDRRKNSVAYVLQQDSEPSDKERVRKSASRRLNFD